MQLTVPVPEEFAQAHSDFVEILEQKETAYFAALKYGSLIFFAALATIIMSTYFLGLPQWLILGVLFLPEYLKGKWIAKKEEFDLRLQPIQRHFAEHGYAIVPDAGRGRGALVLKDYPDYPQSP